MLLKQKINIELIGKKRFYSGTVLGVFISIVIIIVNSLLRYKTGNIDIVRFDYFLNFFYYFGVGAYASGISLLVWLKSNDREQKKWRYLLSGKNIIRIYLIIFLPYVFKADPVLLSHYKQDVQYSAIAVYPYIMYVLLPIVLFFSNWTVTSLVFKSGRFRFYNLLICIAFGLILSVIMSRYLY